MSYEPHAMEPSEIREELDHLGWSYPPELNEWLESTGCFDPKLLALKAAAKSIYPGTDVKVRRLVANPDIVEIKIKEPSS